MSFLAKYYFALTLLIAFFHHVNPDSRKYGSAHNGNRNIHCHIDMIPCFYA